MRAAADWTSASLKGKENEYTYWWSAEDTAELDAAVQKLKPRISTEDDVLQVRFGLCHAGLCQLLQKFIALDSSDTLD